MNTVFTRAWRCAAMGALVWVTLCAVANAGAVSAAAASPTDSPARTEITLMRFFGSCESKYGTTIDLQQANGECGIITTLVNRFNATNRDGIVVRTQIAEWGPFYDQLNARLVSKDAPTISVMHESVLGDYVQRKLVMPLDEGFKQVGIDTADFTDHARSGVMRNGVSYALPFDTWSWLWHININLMRQAGLIGPDGKAVLPRSPEELLTQARQFKKATGKPYFTWALANETVAYTRTFLTLVEQQGAQIFAPDGRSIHVHTPEARKAMLLMQQLYSEGLIKPSTDYTSSNRAWLNGDAGIIVIGTWTIDQYMAEASKASSPVYQGYEVVPFPQLFQRPNLFADGHSWVIFKAGVQDEAQRRAAFTFLKFLYDNDLAWARTGHLPIRRSLVASAEFKALPHRESLASIARDGQGIPGNVPVQRMVGIIIGEEISNLVVGGQPVDQVMAALEKRINVTLRKARR